MKWISRSSLILALLASPAVAQNYPPTSITPQDCSGTVVTGGTAVTALAAAKAPHGFAIWNLDTAEALWINVGPGTAAVATVGSIPLAAATVTTFADTNGSFITPFGFGTGNSLSVVAATAGHKFTCVYW